MAKKISDDNMFFGLDLTDEQRKFRDSIYSDEFDIVFCDARSGTGKTTIAVATAKLMVTNKKKYDKMVYLFSPTQEKELGFLPGGLIEKEKNYYQPLIDALLEINENPDQAIMQFCDPNVKKQGLGWASAMSHTFLRGCNIKNSVVVIDEAQNYTSKQLKKVLTRIHDSCKIVVIGHHLQVDLINKRHSGFIKYLEHFTGKERCKICKLTKNFRGWVADWADSLPEED